MCIKVLNDFAVLYVLRSTAQTSISKRILKFTTKRITFMMNWVRETRIKETKMKKMENPRKRRKKKKNKTLTTKRADPK